MKIPALLALLILGITVQAQTTPPPDTGASDQAVFPDVPPNHWAFAAVQKLAAAGIIEGVPPGEPPSQTTVTTTNRILPMPMKAGATNDAFLTPLIKTALASNLGLHGTQISVDTLIYPKVIILRGRVSTAAQKTLAIAIARKNAPHYTIKDQLYIVPSK